MDTKRINLGLEGALASLNISLRGKGNKNVIFSPSNISTV